MRACGEATFLHVTPLPALLLDRELLTWASIGDAENNRQRSAKSLDAQASVVVVTRDPAAAIAEVVRLLHPNRRLAAVGDDVPEARAS